MAVGIVFGVVFDICIVIGVRLLANFGLSVLSHTGISAHAEMSFPLSAYVKLSIIGIAMLAIVVGVSAALRKIFHGQGGIDSDIFFGRSRDVAVRRGHIRCGYSRSIEFRSEHRDPHLCVYDDNSHALQRLHEDARHSRDSRDHCRAADLVFSFYVWKIIIAI